ncbi:MAG: pseudouridine-5'-phosphate glycosidase [Trueperaceae bacterium]
MSLRISPAVQIALSRGRPVVALESTVITHGLPRPQNLELARELENVVRQEGAVPATVAVIAGELVVGIGEDDLELLAGDARANDGAGTETIEKASLWNLAALLARRADAGTTVAATLHAADAAGIEVFATGGIGGVHSQPYDESADLLALARSKVITVCSGPKSILLAGATLERLETLGVPVVGFRSTCLAGFHVRETDYSLPASFDSPEELAGAFRRHLELRLPGGMLVSNPVSQGLDRADLTRYREIAEQDAAAAGVSGKELTPFLLSRLAELSESRTVEVNLRLLLENARLAARIAVALRVGEPINDRTPRSTA